MKILFIEKEPPVAKQLVEKLPKIEFQLAESSKQAEELLSSEQFDLLITDVLIEEYNSAFILLEKLQKEQKQLPRTILFSNLAKANSELYDYSQLKISNYFFRHQQAELLSLIKQLSQEEE